MTEMFDKYYRILGLTNGASKAEIKRAYRKLAMRYHPDKNPGNEERTARIFIAVNQAYSVLIDSVRIEDVLETVDDAKLYFKRRFYDLIRRINSDSFSTEIQQEECDFFFKYQLEEVHHVRKSKVEAKRIIDLIKKAALKGYDMSMIIEDHGEFLKKYGFDDQDDYQANCDLIVEYQRIIAREPGNADAHCNLGILYERQGMIQLAVSQYRKALAIDYNNARSKRALERLKVDLF